MTAVDRRARARAPRRKSSAQEAREALYRELVLEAAEARFAAKGIDATRMEEIAADAGLSLGTVYSVFRGKPAIVDALHEARLRDLLQRSIDVARGLEDPLEMLIAGTRAYVEYFLAHPNTLRIQLGEGRSWGLPLEGGSLRAAAWAEGHAMQARLFRRGIEAGIFHRGDPGRLARTLAAMQQVRLADWLEGGMREDPDEIVSELELQLRRAFCALPGDRERVAGPVAGRGERRAAGT
jgi:AcrR family transcriptional regulator